MPKHEVPFKLIDFVAKTGFITKDLWRKYFFTGGNERWMHQSWTNLHEHEYLKPHPEPALKDVSVLDLKSPKNKFLWEGKPVKHVYASHINHDVHLYEGLLKLERSNSIDDWETEAQMKSRLGEHFYRNGFSGETVKFPDVLVYLPEMELPWAIEMEMTRKNNKRYERTMNAYSMRKDIGGVAFICRTSSIEKALFDAKSKTPFGDTKFDRMSLDLWDAKPEALTNHLKKYLCTDPTSNAG